MSIAQKISVVKRNFGHHIISSTMCLGGGVEDYGARIRRAWREWHTAHDPDVMPWAEIQRRVAKALRKPETSVAVLKWKDGLQEPTLAEFRALAEVLEAEPAKLAFGEAVPKPDDDNGDGTADAGFPPRKPPPRLDVPGKAAKKQRRG